MVKEYPLYYYSIIFIITIDLISAAVIPIILSSNFWSYIDTYLSTSQESLDTFNLENEKPLLELEIDEKTINFEKRRSWVYFCIGVVLANFGRQIYMIWVLWSGFLKQNLSKLKFWLRCKQLNIILLILICSVPVYGVGDAEITSYGLYFLCAVTILTYKMFCFVTVRKCVENLEVFKLGGNKNKSTDIK